MDAPQAKQSESGAKVWDFVYGSLLVGAVPLATYYLLAFLADWPCEMVLQHYGEQAAFRLQMVLLTVAFSAAVPAFIFAILWRVRHRILPIPFIGLEVVIGLLWAFFFMFFCALCYHD